MPDRSKPRVLYVIVCAAGPAPDVGKLVSQAQERGWTPYVIATPAALGFLDISSIEKRTGHPVRSRYRSPDEPHDESLPPPDGIIVAPATFNTVNKLACGINDNYALGLLAEAVGTQLAVVAVPFVNSALAGNPAFGRAVAKLRAAGVDVMHGAGDLEPHPPRSGGEHMETFPWHRALDRLGEMWTPRS